MSQSHPPSDPFLLLRWETIRAIIAAHQKKTEHNHQDRHKWPSWRPISRATSRSSACMKAGRRDRQPISPILTDEIQLVCWFAISCGTMKCYVYISTSYIDIPFWMGTAALHWLAKHACGILRKNHSPCAPCRHWLA